MNECLTTSRSKHSSAACRLKWWSAPLPAGKTHGHGCGACMFKAEENWWSSWLVDEDGFVVDEAEVQLARLPQPEAWHRGLRLKEARRGRGTHEESRSVVPAGA